jgi:hypothetical protein
MMDILSLLLELGLQAAERQHERHLKCLCNSLLSCRKQLALLQVVASERPPVLELATMAVTANGCGCQACLVL